MKKKIFSTLAAGFAACMLSACGGDSSSPTNSFDDNQSSDTSQSSSSSLDNQVSSSSVISADKKDAHKDSIANTYAKNPVTPVENFSDFKYYGAELTGLDQFKYGRFEAKMKMVSVSGSVSSMFLYYDNSWMKGDEPWNEIDIEVLGKNPGEWQSNLITRNGDGKQGKNTSSEFVTGFGFDATQDFHVYAMVWTPEYISWEIDGVEIRRDVAKPGEEVIAKNQVTFMTEEQSLRFNLWASKSKAWVGEFTGAELADGPVVQEIDYVKVYSYDETTKEFKEEWTDEFEGDDLDAKHWSRGNWEMEHVTLSKKNVVVENGVCKLMLSREEKSAADITSSSSDKTSSSSVKNSSSSMESISADSKAAFKKTISNTIAKNPVTPVSDFSSYNYYGAELTGLDQFKYGRFEAKMKMVSVSGSVSSMFLYYDNSWKKGEEPWNEIDIEVLGKNPGEWQSNLITREGDGTKGDNTSSEFVTGFGFDATKDFHVYVMEWTPEYISWKIDDVEIRRDVAKAGEAVVAKNQVTFMTKEQSLRFNLWASKSAPWVGEFTGAELAGGPVAQEIDYVRVYKYDEKTKSFVFDWEDEFEGSTLDSKHWSKGNWEMEHVMLSEDNVVVENGVCKLLLSRERK